MDKVQNFVRLTFLSHMVLQFSFDDLLGVLLIKLNLLKG